MWMLCNILSAVLLLLCLFFFLLAALSDDHANIFVFLAVVCFLAAVALSSLGTCLKDGVVTVEYFFTQCYNFFFGSSSGQHCDCCSCLCGR